MDTNGEHSDPEPSSHKETLNQLSERSSDNISGELEETAIRKIEPQSAVGKLTFGCCVNLGLGAILCWVIVIASRAEENGYSQYFILIPTAALVILAAGFCGSDSRLKRRMIAAGIPPFFVLKYLVAAVGVISLLFALGWANRKLEAFNKKLRQANGSESQVHP